MHSFYSDSRPMCCSSAYGARSIHWTCLFLLAMSGSLDPSCQRCLGAVIDCMRTWGLAMVKDNKPNRTHPATTPQDMRHFRYKVKKSVAIHLSSPGSRIHQLAQVTICKSPIWIELGNEWVSFEFFGCWPLIRFNGKAFLRHKIIGCKG